MRFAPTALGLAVLSAVPAAAEAPPPQRRVDPGLMSGRWYEVARMPNRMQRNCQGGTSDWTPTATGFSVVQACHRGSLDAPRTEWKARARVVDPRTNAKFKMSFFGGMVNQEYWVIDHRADQGWIILGTPGGNFLWLMSQKPSLSQTVRAEALSRIKQLGYDVGRLEFPPPARR